LRRVFLCILVVASLALFVLPSFASSDPTKEKLVSALQVFIINNYPNYKDARIEINLDIPDQLLAEISKWGNVSFAVSPQLGGFRPFGKVSVPYASSKKNRRIFISGNVEVFRKVLVAKKDLIKKQIVAFDDFELVEKEVAKNQQKYYTDSEKIAGLELTVNLKQGQVLFGGMLREKPIVAAGDRVSILVVTSNIKVITTGVALDDGAKGSVIRIKRDGYNKTLKAKVDEPGKVILEVN
jgi:flagella basal body P-ring formation protein FlgA